MAELSIRPLTPVEFDAFRDRLVRRYAGEHVRAGNWEPRDAEATAARQTDALLPDGVDTEGALLLAAEDGDGRRVGSLWVMLNRPDGAWIYDIEVEEDQRGKGYGRALLEAAEREAARHGVDRIGLNVFGSNSVARTLYESAGYEVVSLQLRKRLPPAR
jgi:ribosomal protein S18 acetylase RimI-like enzyme